jgi:hypothetical protein
MRIWSIIAASTALLLSAGGACAQSLIAVPDFGTPTDLYGRGKNTSVLERERPDYQAIGIHDGGFTIYPRLVVSGETDSNVYATPNGKSDSLVRITPSVVAQSNWGRHSLTLTASAEQTVFDHYTAEDSTTWALRGVGRIDVHGQSYISVGGDIQHSVVARESEVTVIDTKHPVTFNTQGVYIRALYGEDRIRASVDGVYRNFQYDNTTDTSGAFVQEDERNFADYSGSGRVDYALSPDEALFGKASYDKLIYDLGTMNAPLPAGAFTDKRNSTTWRALTGANFDISNLARGEIGVGYIDREYESDNFTPVKGFSAAAKVEYFPTRLLTVTVVAQRQVQDASFSTTGGFFQNIVTGEADYELRRNIIVSGAAGYEVDQFQGQNRTDHVWNVQGQGRYFMNRNVGIGATLSYANRDSNLAYPQAPHFEETRFALSLVFQR